MGVFFKALLKDGVRVFVWIAGWLIFCEGYWFCDYPSHVYKGYSEVSCFSSIFAFNIEYVCKNMRKCPIHTIFNLQYFTYSQVP